MRRLVQVNNNDEMKSAILCFFLLFWAIVFHNQPVEIVAVDYEFRIVFLLEWLPARIRELGLLYYFTHGLSEVNKMACIWIWTWFADYIFELNNNYTKYVFTSYNSLGLYDLKIKYKWSYTIIFQFDKFNWYVENRISMIWSITCCPSSIHFKALPVFNACHFEGNNCWY